MPITEQMQIEKREGKTYEPLPENIYQVELLDITLKETPKYKQPDEIEKVFDFQFTLLDGKDKKGESLRGRSIWRNFVPTYLYIGKKGKNVLYQIVEAILGEELSPEQEAKLDTEALNSLIGEQLRVLVKNNTKDKKTYSNIESFLSVETKINSLTDDEKESAKVKPKEEKEETNEDVEEIKIEDIPFG